MFSKLYFVIKSKDSNPHAIYVIDKIEYTFLMLSREKFRGELLARHKMCAHIKCMSIPYQVNNADSAIILLINH